MISQRPKKILILEDEREIALLIKHYLEKEGCHTCLAETGLEAQKLVASEHPDLVIPDLMLPQVDGLEVCKTLRRKPETAVLPIIMLTAKTTSPIPSLALNSEPMIIWRSLSAPSR